MALDLTGPLLITLGVLFVCSAFFSMTEAAFLAINKVRLRHLVERGSPSAKVAYQLLTQLDGLISTIVVGNNVLNVTIAVLGTTVCVNLLGLPRGPIVAAVVITVLTVVFAEIAPKLFAAGHATRIALVVAWPVRWLIILMRPFVWLFTGSSQLLIRVLGGHRLKRAPLVTEEELKVMIEMGREAGALTEHELRLFQRLFEFSDVTVNHVMIPRKEIAAVEASVKPEAAFDVMVEEGHSRIPVYRGTLDHVVGMLYARDLLATVRHGGLFVLSDLVRPVAVVRESKRAAELVREFQRDHTQVAIVQNAKGYTSGLVTMEDLLEEIVGEIHEEAPVRHRKKPDHPGRAPGKTAR